jgi:lambda repressor-like predicted transcriptional regulator
MIDKELKEAGHTWRSLSKILGESESNLKRKLVFNFNKVNKWLEPLGLELKIVSKEGWQKENEKTTNRKANFLQSSTFK